MEKRLINVVSACFFVFAALFLMNIVSALNILVDSPNDSYYNIRAVPFNIAIDKEVENITYINYNDEIPKWKILCRNCNGFGNSKEKRISLNEGPNNIAIRATDIFNNIAEKNLKVMIESKTPTILKTFPIRNSVTNGDVFSVMYTAYNFNKITLYYGESENIKSITKAYTECEIGEKKECIFENINLNEFNNEYIEYYFEISDFNTVNSEKTRVKADTSSPAMEILSPRTGSIFTKNVLFEIIFSEKVKLEYMDDRTPGIWKTLCTNCVKFKKTIQFSRGIHNILIRATDKAGNFDIKTLNLEILF